MRRQIAVLLVVMVVLPRLVSAQALAPGSRVRFSLTGERSRTGTVVAISTDTLEVRLVDRLESTPVRLPLARMTRLDVSRGKQGHREYAGVGTKVGAAFGAIVGFAEPCSAEPDPQCIPRPTAAVLGAASGAAMGWVVGRIVGVVPRERWEPVPLGGLRGGFVAPSGVHGAAVGLRFGF